MEKVFVNVGGITTREVNAKYSYYYEILRTGIEPVRITYDLITEACPFS